MNNLLLENNIPLNEAGTTLRAKAVRNPFWRIDAGRLGASTVTGLFLLYTFLPVLSVALFSFAGKWNRTILPEKWSLDAYLAIFSNPEFLTSLLRSCAVAFLVVAIDLSFVILAVFGATLMHNKQKVLGAMEIFSIIPVALPGVVLALSCIIFYGQVLPAVLGSPLLLILAEAAFAMPIVFWTIQNGFRNTDIKGLYYAACTLGAPLPRFMLRILIPNINKAVVAAGMMAFSTAFNNFALAQLLVGARWKTIPLLQHNIMKIDGHQTSAMAVVSILVTFILAAIAGAVNKRNI